MDTATKQKGRISRAGSGGTIASKAYDRLRRDILRGSLPPGLKLKTEHLGNQYDVGNTPLREALNRLTADGLVVRKEQRGFSVATLSRKEFEGLLKTRCWLEQIALEESIKNRSQEWEENIVIAFHRLSRVSPIVDDEANPDWEEHHHQFHLALLANCDSEWLLTFCKQLLDHTDRYRQFGAAASYRDRDLLGEHRAIFEATVNGDAKEAVRLLCEHYQRTGQIILESTDAGGLGT